MRSRTVRRVGSRPFPGTFVEENVLGLGPGFQTQQGGPSIWKRQPWKLFRSYSCLIGPRPCQVILPDGCADMTSTGTGDAGFPPTLLLTS